MSETQFAEHEYGALLSLVMVSDPWPTSDLEKDTIVGMLNAEAEARGYNDWIHAYHGLEADVQ